MLTPEDIQKVAQEVVRNLDAIKKPKLTQELIGSLDLDGLVKATTTSQELVFAECPEDEVWEIFYINFSNSANISSGSGIIAKRYKATEGRDFQLYYQANPSANVIYGPSHNFYVFPSQVVVIKLTGNAVGDILQAWITGIKYKLARQ